MEVILLEDVKALGKKGEVVKVSDGYAKNFILKKKLGVEANSANKNDLKLQKANEAKVAQEKLDAAKALAEELKDKKVVIKIKAGNGDRVFGSISAKEIAAETKKQLGLEIDKKKIVFMPSNLRCKFSEILAEKRPDIEQESIGAFAIGVLRDI